MAPRLERPDMADYGVTDETDGLLPWEWAEERLAGSRNYWVTTVNADGRPHSMPVWGVWLADAERFWFSCSPKARKTRNIRDNPGVVVAPTDTVEVVSLEGRAVETSGNVLETTVETYFAKYGEEMGEDLDMDLDGVRKFLVDNASFEVIPERAFGIIERADEFAERATRWSWPGT